MATKLGPVTSTVSAPGTVAIGFSAAPVGGFNATAELNTASSASVQLQVRLNATWILADTLNLDATTPAKNVPVYPPWEAARWNVLSVTGGTIDLNAVGVGV